MNSFAGHKLLDWLNTEAGSSPHWSVSDYWNETNEDTGKINLHHIVDNWDFYVMREFKANDDEVLYVQPLSTVYSNYGIVGVTPAARIAGEPIACSFASRPWLEHGVVQGRGDAIINAVIGENAISWVAQVGISNLGGVGYSAAMSMGLIGDYRYAGGLPYDVANERPFRLKDHFFTGDGSIVTMTGISAANLGTFVALSFDDMLLANPFIDGSDFTFQVFRISCVGSHTWAGSIPDLYAMASHRITLEATDGLTLYLPEEVGSKVFQDGSRGDRYVAMLNVVEI
jgi:hypothetical protein